MTKMTRFFPAAVTACALAACGGSGGTVASAPPPAPAPAPNPAPPPPSSTARDGEFLQILDLSSSQALAVVTNRGPSYDLKVRYDADQQIYLMDFPGLEEGGLYATFETSPGVFESTLADPANPDRRLDIYMSVYRPDKSQYSAQGLASTPIYNPDAVFFAMGTPTQPLAMPTSGQATYEFQAIGGSTLDYVGGTGAMTFDFGIGSLSGYFDVEAVSYDYASMGSETSDLGRYDFVATVYSAGATQFSGGLLNGANGHSGSFSGLFTGPVASELISNWSLTYSQAADPTITSTAAGVWVGIRK
ncbi:hypothetical protein [Sphingomicrobium nitratireducens]|uniref:hypothetical protein n=1 Tax=Sphingomicrobium nitratireducens TaxID=2964666 RepID=UPI00224086CD|nr:hypothetical protein [Sphingomicrobium nitratireducens]